MHSKINSDKLFRFFEQRDAESIHELLFIGIIKSLNINSIL